MTTKQRTETAVSHGWAFYEITRKKGGIKLTTGYKAVNDVLKKAVDANSMPALLDKLYV